MVSVLSFAAPSRAQCRGLGRHQGHIRHTERSGRRQRHTGSTTAFSNSQLGLLLLRFLDGVRHLSRGVCRHHAIVCSIGQGSASDGSSCSNKNEQGAVHLLLQLSGSYWRAVPSMQMGRGSEARSHDEQIRGAPGSSNDASMPLLRHSGHHSIGAVGPPNHGATRLSSKAPMLIDVVRAG
jgi:hypothetical protein